MQPAKRVRRTPENARAEILAAAEAALRDSDLHSLTVETLMERTGMTRSLFYHYFKSLDEIVMIPGADKLDSLNVSVAAGILAYELHMQLSASTL